MKREKVVDLGTKCQIFMQAIQEYQDDLEKAGHLEEASNLCFQMTAFIIKISITEPD